jgi:DNA (cytosine-5)-methyltransferase 1
VKLGGLFSGVGGFELAWTQLGHEVAWMCEVDKKAQAVLRERFPGVTIYDDVRKINPAKVEAVDVLTGGSPCQGFSVAGKRTGLQHEQSTLFHDYIRIMDGLADRGLQWAVWENVPGVLSIKNPDGGRTFPHVISGLLGAAEPAPLDPRHKWNVGVAAYGGREVAWRVLDSQHFGVAQRRRRLFACVAFGHPDAGAAGRALLAQPEGVPGDTDEGGTARQEASGAVTQSSKDSGVIAAQPFRKSRRAGHAADDETWVADGRANTLNVFDVSEVRSTHAVVEQLTDGVSYDGYNQKLETGIHRPLRIGRDSSDFVADATTVKHGVRRLTPVECERLQAFPDNWTEPAGSDSARYKAMGNAVTVNTVRWVLGRIAGGQQQ